MGRHTTTEQAGPTMGGSAESISRWFSGRHFPLAALSVLGSVVVLVSALLFIPDSAGTLGSFAADFRKWCFGTDDAGQTQTVRAVLYFLDPLVLAAIIFFLWKKPLMAVRAGEVASYASASLALVLGTAGFFVWQSRTAPELAFPAERIRTAQVVPAFRLVDHTGRPASPGDHRGQVVLLTAFYTTCHNTCPLILNQVKRVVATLPDASTRELTVMAVTLDPEHDGIELLAKAAKAQDLEAPTYRLLTGDGAAVHGLLQSLGIASIQNPATGTIEHANIMLLVDRNGKIAYRFTLGDTQEKWLGQALALLIDEKPADGKRAAAPRP